MTIVSMSEPDWSQKARDSLLAEGTVTIHIPTTWQRKVACVAPLSRRLRKRRILSDVDKKLLSEGMALVVLVSMRVDTSGIDPTRVRTIRGPEGALCSIVIDVRN
ncbi:MAG TPA: hypothetical protein VGK67_35955 [Myxococcales bacterium]|jgi:hypothetical protein